MITPKSRAIPDGYQSIKTTAFLFKAHYLDDGLGSLEFLIKAGKLGTFWVDDDLSVKEVKSDFWKQQGSTKVVDMFSSSIFDFATLGQPSGFNVRQVLVLEEQVGGLLPSQQTPPEQVKKNRGGRTSHSADFAICTCLLLYRGDSFKDSVSLLKAAKEEWRKQGGNPVGDDTAKNIATAVFKALVLDGEPAPTSFKILKN